MAINMDLWKIQGKTLEKVTKTMLDNENRLEEWLTKDILLLGIKLLVIGRQVITPYGGRIDLLALDEQGDTVVLELKRDKTPRDIVAQVLDYASWTKTCLPEKLMVLLKSISGSP